MNGCSSQPLPPVQPDNCYLRAEGEWFGNPDRWTADRRDPPPGPRPVQLRAGLVDNQPCPPEEGKELCSQKEALSGREAAGLSDMRERRLFGGLLATAPV